MQSVDWGSNMVVDQMTTTLGKQVSMNVILQFKYFKILHMYKM